MDQPKPRVNYRRWLLGGVAPALVVLIAAALAYLLAPAEMPGRDVVVLIRPGLTMPAIARELAEAGVVRNATAFILLSRLPGQHPLAKAGEFQLNTGWTPQEILRIITTTNGIQHRVVVREGLPWWETAKLCAAENLSNQTDFEQAMNNATLLEKYGVPAKNAEGFLFPDTYQLTRSQESNGPAVVEAMLKVFDREAKKLWPQGPPPPDELMRVVTLASLVERETGAPEERPRIAGVFMNRLRLGMRLQCDPTTIYGMGPDFGGKLTRADLENTDNLYNTYARAGLPPGPICSPGLASLKAAMNPEQNDYIYFVAKGDGTHAFSRTLDEHNRAVRFYQLHRDASYRSTLGGPAAPDMAPPPAPATDPANAAKASPAKAEPVKAAKASAAKAKTAKTKSGAKKAKAKTATHQKHKG